MFFIFSLIFRLQAFIASQVPPTEMKEAFRAFDLLKDMTEKGNPNSVTDAAVEETTKQASLVPLTVMQEAVKSFDLLSEMIKEGNPNSLTDAAVGVLATRACIRGAFLNVRVNVRGLKDKSFTEDLLTRGGEMESIAEASEEELIRMATGSV